MPTMSVSDTAKAIADATGCPVSPRLLSEWVYRRKLDPAICPMVGGRRVFARENLHLVIDALRRAGKLRAA